MRRLTPLRACALAFVLLVLLLAGGNAYLGVAAERDHPPTGRFLTFGGVKLHYVEEGEGEALVLLHGNGASVEDFQASGLVGLAARRYHVIAFDRPGFGYSTRPAGTQWTPAMQATLFRAALARLGVRRAIVVGHSWGALVAATMALQDPNLVAGLVLVSGYYYPDPRLDVRLANALALPGVNAAVSYTLTPALSRLAWPLVMDTVFGPEPVPPKFAGFSKEMALRPWQLEAATQEVAMLTSATEANAARYGELAMPIAIVVGTGDRLIDPQSQSVRLHGQLPRSSLHLIPQGGHMVQQTATAEVMAAIDEVAVADRQFAARTRAAALAAPSKKAASWAALMR
ncbi:alpha/beta fold hydrolase [Azorhizobium doebereinerae]|uniref:alpha/beta fold hydrolase n=1 Tax=Azorhizobium doebereinerae TaxID=281091 RepID=UPI000409B9CA|nr:alpha/beta hydrolase [Azorhizobium doebereinerae]